MCAAVRDSILGVEQFWDRRSHFKLTTNLICSEGSIILIWCLCIIISNISIPLLLDLMFLLSRSLTSWALSCWCYCNAWTPLTSGKHYPLVLVLQSFYNQSFFIIATNFLSNKTHYSFASKNWIKLKLSWVFQDCKMQMKTPKATKYAFKFRLFLLHILL